MKAYIFDTINRYKRFSENLDVKTVLCNKTWLVFNDGGEKEVYIFQEDGSLIISLNGRVTNATWKYISANKSLIIAANEQSFMVNPAFTDSNIFALQIDGTNNYSFLIDEKNQLNFKPKSFKELQQYFDDKEQRLLKKEQQFKKEEKAKNQALNNYHKMLEDNKREIDENRQKNIIAEKVWEYRKENVLKNDEYYQWQTEEKRRTLRYLKYYPIIGCICCIFIAYFMYNGQTVGIFDAIGFFFVMSILIIIVYIWLDYDTRENIKCCQEIAKDKFIEKFMTKNKHLSSSELKQRYKVKS